MNPLRSVITQDAEDFGLQVEFLKESVGMITIKLYRNEIGCCSVEATFGRGQFRLVCSDHITTFMKASTAREAIAFSAGWLIAASRVHRWEEAHDHRDEIQ